MKKGNPTLMKNTLGLHDRKGEKIIGKVRKLDRYDDTITGEGNYNTMHDKSLYEA